MLLIGAIFEINSNHIAPRVRKISLKEFLVQKRLDLIWIELILRRPILDLETNVKFLFKFTIKKLEAFHAI